MAEEKKKRSREEILDQVVEKAHQEKLKSQKKKTNTSSNKVEPKTTPKKITSTVKKEEQPKKRIETLDDKPKKEETLSRTEKNKQKIEELTKQEQERQKGKEVVRKVEKKVIPKEEQDKLKKELRSAPYRTPRAQKKEETSKENIIKKVEAKKEEKPIKKKKRSKFKTSVNIVSLIIGILFLISMVTMFGLVTYLNILPVKYYIPFTIVCLLFTLLVCFMLMNFKIKKGIKIFFSVIGVLVVAVSVVVFNYAMHTFDFLKDISNADMKITEKYYVLVKADSTYTTIEDVKEFTIGTFNENTNVYQEAIKKLTKINDFTLVECDSSITNIENLLSGESTVIFLSNLHKDQYMEDHKDFEKQIKIIETIEVEVDSKEEEVVTIKPVSDDVMTIFISGIDTYGGISLRSRSDVNMLVTVNKKNHEILLTSIPRDYYVQLHGTTGYRDKLTHAGIYGVNMSVQTIQDFMGIDINYYVRVNFSTLEAVVNSIGGVDVYSDITFRPLHHQAVVIKQGMNHMDGKTALAFARERYAYQEGDRHRVRNQQEVLKAIINKATSDVSILTRYTTLLNNISPYFQTNVDMNEVASIVKIQLDKMPSWNIKQYSLDGTGSKGPTHSMGNTPLYVMEPNQETINTAAKYINGMTKGKTFKELGLN